MPKQLNHTIVRARDKQASARFLAEILGLPAPTTYGPFWEVKLDNDVALDYLDADGADPFKHRPGEFNTNDGGRGAYWEDPDGHFLEIITRPYGSGD